MKISAQFATSLQSPAHIAVAEELGYDRAWLHDTPQQSPDAWMMLAPDSAPAPQSSSGQSAWAG